MLSLFFNKGRGMKISRILCLVLFGIMPVVARADDWEDEQDYMMISDDDAVDQHVAENGLLEPVSRDEASEPADSGRVANSSAGSDYAVGYADGYADGSSASDDYAQGDQTTPNSYTIDYMPDEVGEISKDADDMVDSLPDQSDEMTDVAYNSYAGDEKADDTRLEDDTDRDSIDAEEVISPYDIDLGLYQE